MCLSWYLLSVTPQHACFQTLYCLLALTQWGRHCHYNDVIMSVMSSLITSLTIVYSSVYSAADQWKHQSSASLAFVKGIHRWPVNSPHKWPVTRKMFPFDDVIIPDDVLNWIFLNENVRISITISLKFVPRGPINDISALVQIMARRRPGGKALSEPVMVSLLTHTSVTRPQWVDFGYKARISPRKD